MLEHAVETLWSLFAKTIRYLVVDILIDLVLHWLGYGCLALLKIMSGGRFPAGPIPQQSAAMKIGSGVVALLSLFWLLWWLV